MPYQAYKRLLPKPGTAEKPIAATDDKPAEVFTDSLT
ncbi:hypothetical protein BH24BAC1_BH24BAC1_32150 [soil metagenome]